MLKRLFASNETSPAAIEFPRSSPPPKGKRRHEDTSSASDDRTLSTALELIDEMRLQLDKLARSCESLSLENVSLKARINAIERGQSMSDPANTCVSPCTLSTSLHPPPSPHRMEDDDNVQPTRIDPGQPSHSRSDPCPNTNNSPPAPAEDAREAARCLVICRMDEDRSLSPEQQVHHDYASVCKLLSSIGVPQLPVAVYRMPVNPDPSYTHNRLIKVVCPTSKHAKLCLRYAHKLSSPSCPPHYRNIFIRPSYPNPEDRPRPPPIRRNQPFRPFNPHSRSFLPSVDISRFPSRPPPRPRYSHPPPLMLNSQSYSSFSPPSQYGCPPQFFNNSYTSSFPSYTQRPPPQLSYNPECTAWGNF